MEPVGTFCVGKRNLAMAARLAAGAAWSTFASTPESPHGFTLHPT